MSQRTFKVDKPPMEGADVRAWQKTLNAQMATWHVDYRLKLDGIYHVTTRDLTASVCHGLGLNAGTAMKNGVTPELRSKLRDKDQTPAEKERYKKRASWRKAFAAKHKARGVHPPLAKINADSWGWHPGTHDGIDLICDANAPLFAICDGTIVDARSGGWWGKAPSGDVSKGDGIVQIKCSVDCGPFRKGLVFAYGHAEHLTVRKGQKVKAGQVIGKAGLAVAYHTHFMVHAGTHARGIGDRDPRKFVDFAMKSRVT